MSKTAIFLHNHPNFADLIRQVGQAQHIPSYLVEKDYWLMHSLWGLQQQGWTFQLKGGTSEDNAFIMQIGDYVIVEFSKKGNACYFRPYDQNLPFKLDTKILELTPELKGKSKGCESLPHTPTDRGWWHKYDRWFAERGIYPDKQPPMKQPSNKLSYVRQPQQGSTSPMPNKGSIEQAISQALQFIEAESVKFSITDFRDNGGAFWLMIPTPSQGLQNRLLGLGFQYKQGRGYWIK